MESIATGDEETVVPSSCTHFHAAVELIGRRWNGAILRALFEGADRFVTLRAAVPEITDSMLSLRLRELEEAGLVVRTVTGVRPVEIRYGVTGVGERLAPAFAALAAWSVEWGDRAQAAGPAGG